MFLRPCRLYFFTIFTDFVILPRFSAAPLMRPYRISLPVSEGESRRPPRRALVLLFPILPF